MSMDQIVLEVVRVMTHLLFLSPDQNHCDESVLSYSHPADSFQSFSQPVTHFPSRNCEMYGQEKNYGEIP